MKVSIFRQSLISSLFITIFIYVLNLTEYVTSDFNSEVLYSIISSSLFFYPFFVLPILLIFFSFVWRLAKPIIEAEEKYTKLYLNYASTKGRMICVSLMIIIGIYFGLK
jgi:hypothetical protein